MERRLFGPTNREVAVVGEGTWYLESGDRASAIAALERARLIEPTVEGLLDLALAYHLAGDVGAEVSAGEAATIIDPESQAAWSAFAHALARTARTNECVNACRRALAKPAVLRGD